MKKQQLHEALAVLLAKLSSARDNPLLMDNYVTKALRTVLMTFKESGELHEAYKEQIQSTLESDNPWITMMMKSMGADLSIKESMTDETIEGMVDSMLREQTMKDWTGNRKSMFVTLGASNHTDKERESNDFYATDPIAIDKLVKVIQLPRKIWECACGTGCLSERLKDFGHEVVSTDLVDRGYGWVRDFLETTELPNECACILTNPPYKYALDFIKHSLELLSDDGLCIMFLKTTFLEGQKRYDELFSKHPPQYVLQFSRRVLCAKNGEFQKMKDGGGSAVSYAWFVWKKGFHGDTIIKWI